MARGKEDTEKGLEPFIDPFTVSVNDVAYCVSALVGILGTQLNSW